MPAAAELAFHVFGAIAHVENHLIPALQDPVGAE